MCPVHAAAQWGHRETLEFLLSCIRVRCAAVSGDVAVETSAEYILSTLLSKLLLPLLLQLNFYTMALF